MMRETAGNHDADRTGRCEFGRDAARAPGYVTSRPPERRQTWPAFRARSCRIRGSADEVLEGLAVELTGQQDV